MGLFGGPGSEARAKAKKYGNLAEKLEGNIAKIKGTLEVVETALASSHESFLSNSTAAEGMLNTDFEEHEENWKTEYTMILNRVNAGIQSLELRKNAAREWEAHWYQVAEMEEMEAMMTNGGF